MTLPLTERQAADECHATARDEWCDEPAIEGAGPDCVEAEFGQEVLDGADFDGDAVWDDWPTTDAVGSDHLGHGDQPRRAPAVGRNSSNSRGDTRRHSHVPTGPTAFSISTPPMSARRAGPGPPVEMRHCVEGVLARIEKALTRLDDGNGPAQGKVSPAAESWANSLATTPSSEPQVPFRRCMGSGNTGSGTTAPCSAGDSVERRTHQGER